MGEGKLLVKLIQPQSVELKHLAGTKQAVSFFDKRKVIPILGYQLGFRHKTALYDQIFTLAAGDNEPHDICYDPKRNRIWIVCHTNPPRVLRMNPETFAYDRLILVGVNDLGYRIAYDGKWIWVTTSTFGASAYVARINPDTLTYDFLALPDDGNHDRACALAVGAGYVWVGCGSRGPVLTAYLLRFELDTTPLTYTEVNIRPVTIPPYWVNIREIVYDGTRIWCGGGAESPVSWVDPVTMAVTSAVPEVFDAGAAVDIICGFFDGSFLWWGSEDGRIAKMNPDTYAFDIMPLQLAACLHRMSFDGKYIHMIDYATGIYYIFHPETMEYSIYESTATNFHGVCFDGLNIWLIDTVTPGQVWRILFHEPSRRVEHGRTDTFAIDALANISIPITFDLPFSRTPIVVVSLNDITDQAASIVNVEAQTVTVNGFNARCRVAVVGAAGSTARFMWIATERSTHHP